LEKSLSTATGEVDQACGESGSVDELLDEHARLGEHAKGAKWSPAGAFHLVVKRWIFKGEQVERVAAASA